MAGTDFCGLLSDSVPRIWRIRSARQEQTENTHILGNKLQRPLLSPYRWNAGWSRSIMKNILIASFISYEKWRYWDIPQNKSVYQLFYNSTEFLCEIDRQGHYQARLGRLNEIFLLCTWIKQNINQRRPLGPIRSFSILLSPKDSKIVTRSKPPLDAQYPIMMFW